MGQKSETKVYHVPVERDLKLGSFKRHGMHVDTIPALLLEVRGVPTAPENLGLAGGTRVE